MPNRTMAPAVRAARLVRVSTRPQAGDDRTSLPHQTRTLTELCERHGWESDDEDLYVEVISGAKGVENREVFGRLLDAIRAGRYQRLCVLDFDRSTRKGLGEWAQIAGVLAEAGCKIVINGQEYDLDEESARLTTNIQAVVAEHERSVIRKRSIRGMEDRAREGHHMGGSTPFGYRAYYPESEGARPRRAIVVHDEEASIVLEIFELYATGTLGFQAIADRLNAAGRRWRGIEFHWNQILRVATCPTYAGICVRRRESSRRHHKVKLPTIVVPSKTYPPIISQELWACCCAIRSSRERRLSYPGRRPLSGILRCETCGGPMYSNTIYPEKPGGELKRYYSCWGAKRRQPECSGPRSVRDFIAHQEVLAVARHLLADLDGLDEALAAPECDPREAELRGLLAELDREELALIGRASLPLEQGGLRDDQLARLNRSLLERRDQIEAELGKFERRRLAVSLNLPELLDLLPSIGPDDPRLGEIARSLFAEIRMAGNGRKVQGCRGYRIVFVRLHSGQEVWL